MAVQIPINVQDVRFQFKCEVGDEIITVPIEGVKITFEEATDGSTIANATATVGGVTYEGHSNYIRHEDHKTDDEYVTLGIWGEPVA